MQILKFRQNGTIVQNNPYVKKEYVELERGSYNVKLSSLISHKVYIFIRCLDFPDGKYSCNLLKISIFTFINFQAISIWARRVIECPPKVLFKSLYSTRLAPWSRCLWSCMTCRICLQIRKHFCDKEHFTCPRKESTKLTCRNGCAIWSISGMHTRLLIFFS